MMMDTIKFFVAKLSTLLLKTVVMAVMAKLSTLLVKTVVMAVMAKLSSLLVKMVDAIGLFSVKLLTLKEHVAIILQVEDGLLRLSDKLDSFQQPLLNIDSLGLKESNDIRSVVYEAEDIISLFEARSYQVLDSSFYEMKSLLGLYERYKTGIEVKSILTRMNTISDYIQNQDRASVQLSKSYSFEQINRVSKVDSSNQIDLWRGLYNSKGTREMNSFRQIDIVRKRKPIEMVKETDQFQQIDMVGFGIEKDTIIKKLFGKSSSLEVISIVGMGGLGKTTLASQVYNDPVVAEYFHTRSWVGVSERYNPRSVLKTIIKGILNLSDWVVDEKKDEELIFEIQKYFGSTRYLVVLDDVWDISPCKDLKELFTENCLGSRIIITTRNANIPNDCALPLRFLTNTESWELLYRRVFNNRSIENHKQFEQLGIKIAKVCGGLPLAVLLAAGILKEEKTTSWWYYVWSNISTYNNDLLEEPCLEILELSFELLPIYLKSCFLYVSLYPEDYVIPTRLLKHLWVAEGFIKSKDVRTLEEIADEYLDELIARNFLQIVERNSDGGIKSCSIHDILWDFCTIKAKNDEYFEVRGHIDSSSLVDSRRLAIYSKVLVYINWNRSSSKLRSLFIFGANENCFEEKHWKLLCDSHSWLRVLDFGDVVVDSVSSRIGQFKCLRFLRLKSDTATILPKSISKLFLLETLQIIAPRIEKPEINVWKMRKLRYVYFNGAVILKKTPKKMVQGQHYYHHNLKTLSSISPDSCRGDLLPKLLNLVNLGILGDLEKLNNETFKILSKLKSLKSLKLIRDLDYGRLTRLPSIELMVNLKKLTLSRIGLTEDPVGQLKKLQSLQILKLKNCAYVGVRLVCVEDGGFPKLEVLQLIRLNIKEWNISATSMPSLRSVAVNSCPSLTDLPSSLKYISTFQELDLLRPTPSAAKKAQEIKDFKVNKKERFKLSVNNQVNIHH